MYERGLPCRAVLGAHQSTATQPACQRGVGGVRPLPVAGEDSRVRGSQWATTCVVKWGGIIVRGCPGWRRFACRGDRWEVNATQQAWAGGVSTALNSNISERYLCACPSVISEPIL